MLPTNYLLTNNTYIKLKNSTMIWLLYIYFNWPLDKRNQPFQIAISQWREKIFFLNLKEIFSPMDSYSFKKGWGVKRHGLEAGIKTGYNIQIWCHESLCI